MTIQKHATEIPSSVNRRATYDRLVQNGSDSGYLHWLQRQRNEFHRLFDRWLEGLK